MREEIACCTLYCGLCASRRRIPEEAKKLRRILKEEGYDLHYFDIPELVPLFEKFWEGLKILEKSPCKGCKNGGGFPDCPIRKCVQEKGLFSCADCPDSPCETLKSFLKNYPLFSPDLNRLKEVGYDEYEKEQEERASRGFSYADVRYLKRKET